ncbi:MAG: glutaredoxin 3 [Gammaproteobacteria bacterium]
MTARPEITIYTRALCGYCSAARELLDSKGADYRDLDTTLNRKLRAEMETRSGRQTVPQIFIGEQHIGGYDDMAALDAAGELDSLLSGASDT